MKSDIKKEIKEEKLKTHISESFHVAAILAISGGYMDAYTYLVRGEVFANAQTGNIVLLGIKIMDGKMAETVNYLIPILAFSAGILMAELIRNKDSLFQRADWRQIVLLIEIAALIIAAFLPVGSMDTLANTLISFVSALQMGSFRYVNGNAFVSTMCTGNLRSGTQCLYHHVFRGDKAMKTRWMHYYGIILFFIAGAAMGAWATHQLSDGISIGNWSAAKLTGQVILGSCLLLAVAVWRMRERKGQNQRTNVKQKPDRPSHLLSLSKKSRLHEVFSSIPKILILISAIPCPIALKVILYLLLKGNFSRKFCRKNSKNVDSAISIL